MPQLDINTYLPQVVWLVITFSALYLIMWRVVVPRIADVLEARQKRIDDNLDKAAESKDEAETALAAYEAALTDARDEAQALIGKAAATMSDEAGERHARLDEDLDRRIAEAEAAISDAVAAAMENVRMVAQEVAAAALERLTGEAPAAKAVAEAVGRASKAHGREPGV